MRLLVLVLAAVCVFGCGEPPRGNQLGNMAPDVTVSVVGSDKKVKLSELKGKVVLIDFWATWCGPCKMIEPEIDEMYAKYKDKGFDVLAVSTEPIGELNQFLKERKTTYPIHHDFAGLAEGAYKVEALPRQFLISREGRIIWEQEGATPGVLKAEIETAMG